jgi:hypothetical protein
MQQPVSGESTFIEKRRHLRVPVAAAAVVLKENACLGRFWMVDLSVGGALVAGDIPVALGDRVALRIELGTQQSVRLDATVVRLLRGPRNPAVAFAFEESGTGPEQDDSRRTLAHLVAGALKNDPRAVLIVEDSPVASRELKFQVRCLGWACVTVPSALDAIVLLKDAQCFAFVLVGMHGKAEAAAALRRFLAETHPQIGRLTVAHLESLRGGRAPLLAPDASARAEQPAVTAMARALGV